jgi:hypothetical protein
MAAIEEQIRLEDDEIGDQFLLRLLCAQLFSIGVVEDAMLIWRAKSCNFDTGLGIDIQFLCGAGLEPTKEFLRGQNSDEARDALEYLAECESSADFSEFSVDEVVRQAKCFYGVA